MTTLKKKLNLCNIKYNNMPEITYRDYTFIKTEYMNIKQKEQNFRDLSNIANARLARYKELKIHYDRPDYIHIKNRSYFLRNLYRSVLNELLCIHTKWLLVQQCTIKDENSIRIKNKKKVKICTENNQVYVFDE